MNDVYTTELPTLTFAPVEYRTGPREFGLFHGATRNINPGQSMHDWSPDQLWDYGNYTSAHAVSIWNEAHNEHDRRAVLDWEQALLQEAAIVEQPTREVELERLLTVANAEIERLRTEQIEGSDPRLTEFWKKANEVATEGGQCSVYDQMAQELGGPGRPKQHNVTVQVSFNVQVTAEGLDGENAFENIEEDVLERAVVEFARTNNLDNEIAYVDSYQY